jgi:DNA-binding response OmpR family regulator
MKTLSYQSEPVASLTRLQAALREYLRAHSGETIRREQLCLDVWRMNYFHSSRTIDQTISIVRKHLAEDERIITVFGVGYRHENLSYDVDAPVFRPRELRSLVPVS